MKIAHMDEKDHSSGRSGPKQDKKEQQLLASSYYSDSSSSKSEDGNEGVDQEQHREKDAVNSTQSGSEESGADRNYFFGDESTSASSGSASDEAETATKAHAVHSVNERLANPFAEERHKNSSVLSTPFREKEDRKLATLSQHVAVVDKPARQPKFRRQPRNLQRSNEKNRKRSRSRSPVK